jgi:tRNA pseudouridine synthase 10
MSIQFKDKKILKIAEKTWEKYKLCDHCFGRLFAKIGSQMTNKMRGELLRNHLNIDEKTDLLDCWLCCGLLLEIKYFADLVIKELKGYEFETFLVGTKVDEDILKKEMELFEYAGSEYTESIKSELNREIGKILENTLEKEVDFERPTIMIIIDTMYDILHFQIIPLFIYGRYKKYIRDIPQTKWFCKICRGKGCRKCGYTGKTYKTSVEELIANKFLELTGGDNESFHGCGREDVDVRMLGNGRPFVLEIKNPRVRALNLIELENQINENNKNIIQVSDLRFSDRDEIKRIKKSDFKKSYRVVFEGKKPLNNGKLKKASRSLGGIRIGQLTPSRVAHRRADLVRRKYIYNCQVESIKGSSAIITLEVESGTYIKELISGDEGRTKPNISEMIGIPCKVKELDVIDIQEE